MSIFWAPSIDHEQKKKKTEVIQEPDFNEKQCPGYLFVNLRQTGVIWEERTSIKKLPCLDWMVLPLGRWS